MKSVHVFLTAVSLKCALIKTRVLTFVYQDRARNVSERFSTTTTLTVNVRDDDDQNPSFIYQGCMLHEGSCINPEYSTAVSASKSFNEGTDLVHLPPFGNLLSVPPEELSDGNLRWVQQRKVVHVTYTQSDWNF
jgi:hypothetical protein